MKKIITLLSALLISASSLADISLPAVQQALHDSVSIENGFASDHVFTCQDRAIVRCDEADNIIILRQYLDDERQLDADFSVFTHLEEYYVVDATTHITKIPAGLVNLPTLRKVRINADAYSVPVIDGNAFPANMSALTVHAAKYPISLINWQAHHLTSLTVSSSDLNFNHNSLSNLVSLNLTATTSYRNVDFTSFTAVTSFSWQRQFKEDAMAYNLVRVQFPLLVAEMIDINLNRINAKEAALTEIPSYILNIPNLRSLEITGHAITELPAQLFAIPTLKHLDVSSNKITTLPVIAENSTLEYLSLERNQLAQIPDALFQLTGLSYLDVSTNKINHLPAELFSMGNLQTLNAGFNEIQSITPMSTTSSLQTVNLIKNKLSQVPVTLLQLDNLLSLNLSHNELATLPEITASNASLQILRINDNAITTLPLSLFNDLPLKELQTSGNEISSLPEGIVNSSIENLSLADNQFVQIPNQLPLFAGLKQANFSKNAMEVFGEQWKQSTSLEEIRADNNLLNELTAEMLNNLPASLRLLSLNNNKMVGELPNFTKLNPELTVNVANNALWSADSHVLRKYGSSNVLKGQLLPVRGIRVTEKTVDGELASYIQWGFPLMQDIDERTRGTHPRNYNGPIYSDMPMSDVNPGPYISTGYRLVIEYTQGKKAGQTITREFSCFVLIGTPLFCNFDRFSASYSIDSYDSSVVSYGVKGSLADANITVYSTLYSRLSLYSLSSSPTYWRNVEAHEQFVDELQYDDALLPAPEDLDNKFMVTLSGATHYYHLLALLVLGLIRVRMANKLIRKPIA